MAGSRRGRLQAEAAEKREGKKLPPEEYARFWAAHAALKQGYEQRIVDQ